MNKILFIILLVLVIFGIYININKQLFQNSTKNNTNIDNSIPILIKNSLNTIYIHNSDNTKEIDELIEHFSAMITAPNTTSNNNGELIKKISDAVDLYLKPKLTNIIVNNPENYDEIIDLLKQSLLVLIYIKGPDIDKCGKGQIYNFKNILYNINNSDTKEICKTCNKNNTNNSTYEYQDKDNHFECTPDKIPYCKAGQKLNNDPRNSDGLELSCVDCDVNTYQNNPTHQSSTCAVQRICPAGTRYPIDPPNHRAIITEDDCTPCKPYTYLDDDMASKKATKCNPHEPCKPGKHINTDNMYYDNSNNGGNTYPVYINNMINMINDKTGTGYTPEEYYKYLPVHEKLLTTNCVECDEYTYLEKPSINSDNNNYGRHYEFKCNTQPTCQSGSKYYESSNRDTIRKCISCDKYEYLDQSISQTLPVGTNQVGTNQVGTNQVGTNQVGTNQVGTNQVGTLPVGRGKTCLPQSTCGKGTFYPKNFSKETKLNVNTDCKPCGENTYQDDMEHRNYICKDQPLCNAGEILAFSNSTLPVKPGLTKQTYEMECRECKSGTYTDKPYHREYSCEPQPTCQAGEKYPESPRLDKLRECIECDSNEYLTNDMANKKATECKSQPYCGSGYKMTPDTITDKRYCEACPDGKFQDNEFHRESQCLVHPSINGDKYLAFYDEKSKNKQPGIFKTFGEELKECDNKDYCLLTDNMSGNPYNIYKETTTQV